MSRLPVQPIEGPDQMNAISNPVLLVEVISESTAAYDRGQKFWFYSRLASLKEYVLIEQDEPSVEVRYRAASDQEWVMSYVEGLDSELLLRSLDVRLPLRLLYEDTEGL